MAITTYSVTVHESGEPDADLVIDVEPVAAIPPVLSAPSDVKTGDVTADAIVTTDRATGMLYVVSSTGLPSAAQIKLGQNSTGAAAVIADSQAVTAVGINTIPITGLTAATAYPALRFMHEDVDTNQSNVVSGDGFTTDPAASIPYSATEGAEDGTTVFSSKTMVNRNLLIANDATIETIGLYLVTNGMVTLKIVLRNSAVQYDVVVSEGFSHQGTGWEDLTLATPFEIPASGSYYPAVFLGSSVAHKRKSGGLRTDKAGNVVGAGTTGWSEATANVPVMRVAGTIPP